MILRRVINHMKGQHWTAVFLDFVIVVMGVFMGLQVQNWNQARELHAEQRQVDIRLRSDFQILDDQLTKALAEQKHIILALNTLRTAIDRGKALKIEDEAIKTAIIMGRAYPSFPRRSATYTELLSSGRLNLIRDDKLRTALAIYNERIDNSLYNIEQIRAPINSDFVSLVQYAKLTPISKDDVGIQSVVSYDIAAMAKDSEFRRRLNILIGMQTWIYSNLESQRNAIDAVKQALEAENKP